MEREYLTTSKEHPATVSRVTQQIKGTLERIPRLFVVGEISNFKRAGSGHLYFSLKDDQSQIRCNMWRSYTQNLNFRPKDGTQVLVTGTLNVYAPRGEYSLVVDYMEEQGQGALRLAFERLKAKLQAEGLFDPIHKKPLPLLPRKIGVVTSSTGAAIRDILRVLKHRFAGVHVLIFPVRVQGAGAAEEIATGISWLDRQGHCDLIISGRGGGSEEDLWAFNEEVVARAIFAAETPIISAVGHEVDFTIADFVADVRAATPSNAAEMAIRSHLEYHQSIAMAQRTMDRAMQRLLLRYRNRISISESHPIFVRIRNRVNDAQRKLSELDYRMQRRLEQMLQRRQLRLANAGGKLSPERLKRRLQGYLNRVNVAEDALATRSGRLLERLTAKLASLTHRLDDLSPLKILNRGYATVYNQKHKLVRRPEDVAFGEVIQVKLAEGEIHARVVEKEQEAVQESLF